MKHLPTIICKDCVSGSLEDGQADWVCTTFFKDHNITNIIHFLVRKGKTSFDERQPLMEDDLRWMKIFDGRQPLMEDNL